MSTRIACVQHNVKFGDPLANAKRAARTLADLAGQGVQLAVFPEGYLTGYCVDSCQAAEHIAIYGAQLDPEQAVIEAQGYEVGEGIDLLLEASLEHDIMAVVGFAEATDDGTLYNSAILLEPGREPRTYRKSHLPHLGLDRFVRAGSELPVFDTRIGPLGILICFDLRGPEAARVLALGGARLIVLPTNWPEAAAFAADAVPPVRAAENRIFVATCNRVGEENGFRFIGRSGVYDVSGKALAKAGDREEILIADLDLAAAECKKNVVIPGVYESDVFASRQPVLYGPLSR